MKSIWPLNFTIHLDLFPFLSAIFQRFRFNKLNRYPKCQKKFNSQNLPRIHRTNNHRGQFILTLWREWKWLEVEFMTISIQNFYFYLDFSQETRYILFYIVAYWIYPIHLSVLLLLFLSTIAEVLCVGSSKKILQRKIISSVMASN